MPASTPFPAPQFSPFTRRLRSGFAAPRAQSGGIISEAFRGESQIDRQNELWKQLESKLTDAELSQVTAILTMTPAEVAS